MGNSRSMAKVRTPCNSRTCLYEEHCAESRLEAAHADRSSGSILCFTGGRDIMKPGRVNTAVAVSLASPVQGHREAKE